MSLPLRNVELSAQAIGRELVVALTAYLTARIRPGPQAQYAQTRSLADS